MESNKQLLPQARTIDLVTRDMTDEVLVYDLKTHQAHCLNKTAAAVWRYCDGQTPIATMAWSLSQDLNATVSEEVVWLALDQLDKSDLLRQKISKPETVAGMSRRQMMRRIGWTAIAVPLVTSIIAPTAQAANTCVPNATGCTANGTGNHNDGSNCSTSRTCCSCCCTDVQSGGPVTLQCRSAAAQGPCVF